MLALALALSLPAAASDCAIPVSRDGELVAAASSIDAEGCAFLLRTRGYAARLAAAAGLPPIPVALRHRSPEYNAHYFRAPGEPGVIELTEGFVSCHREGLEREAALVMIAHEAGHAVQFASGMRPPPPGAAHRRFEAQADRLGYALLERAGFALNASRGWDSSCFPMTGYEVRKEPYHPARKDRAAEARAERAPDVVIDAGLEPASPEEADQVFRSALRFAPRRRPFAIPESLALNNFDDDGFLKRR